jgi:hypothetical protein
MLLLRLWWIKIINTGTNYPLIENIPIPVVCGAQSGLAGVLLLEVGGYQSGSLRRWCLLR